MKKKAAETADDDDEATSEKKYRKCEKAGCTATCPVCFASAAERFVPLSADLFLFFLTKTLLSSDNIV